jgi:hypothetical protein
LVAGSGSTERSLNSSWTLDSESTFFIRRLGRCRSGL